MLFAPYDCCALVYRDASFAVAPHSQSAAYLATIDRTEYNPMDYAVHLSRKPRGVGLWFSLAVYGTAKYARDIDAIFDTATRVATFVKEAPYLDLLEEPTLPILLFVKPGMAEADIRAWCNAQWHKGNLFCQPTFHCGVFVFRLCFCNPATQPEAVIRLLATLEHADQASK